MLLVSNRNFLTFNMVSKPKYTVLNRTSHEHGAKVAPQARSQSSIEMIEISNYVPSRNGVLIHRKLCAIVSMKLIA